MCKKSIGKTDFNVNSSYFFLTLTINYIDSYQNLFLCHCLAGWRWVSNFIFADKVSASLTLGIGKDHLEGAFQCLNSVSLSFFSKGFSF